MKIKQLSNEQKRMEADERRNKIIMDKKKTAEEESLRAIQVTERKKQKYEQVFILFFSFVTSLWIFLIFSHKKRTSGIILKLACS
jgi:hypothetical protein